MNRDIPNLPYSRLESYGADRVLSAAFLPAFLARSAPERILSFMSLIWPNLPPLKHIAVADTIDHTFTEHRKFSMNQSAANPPHSRLETDGEDSELTEDPDDGLELRGEFAAELQASLEGDSATRPAEEVARRLGLSW